MPLIRDRELNMFFGMSDKPDLLFMVFAMTGCYWCLMRNLPQPQQRRHEVGLQKGGRMCARADREQHVARVQAVDARGGEERQR